MTHPARGWTALAACAAFTALPGSAGSVAQDRPPVTFTKDIAPIVFARCAGCHRPEGPAPFSLLTYQDARRPGSGPGRETVHDVQNYSVDTLDRLIVRLVTEELAKADAR